MNPLRAAAPPPPAAPGSGVLVWYCTYRSSACTPSCIRLKEEEGCRGEARDSWASIAAGWASDLAGAC